MYAAICAAETVVKFKLDWKHLLDFALGKIYIKESKKKKESN